MKKAEILQFYTKYKIIINIIFWLIMAYFFGLLQDEHTR